MIQKTLRPFLTLSETDVNWEANSFGKTLLSEGSTYLENWHPGIEIPLNVQIKFDKSRAISTLLLQGLESNFGVYATAFSAATGFKWVSDIYPVENDSEEFSFQLPSQVFAVSVALEFSLVVLSRLPGGSSLSPRLNSVISRAKFHCTLEGEATRPSVALVNFTDPRITDSLWEIETRFPQELAELEYADISTTFTIKINQKLYEKHGSEISYMRGLASEFLNTIIENSLADPELGKALIETDNLEDKGSLWISCKVALTAVFGDADFFGISNEYSKKRSLVKAKIQMVAANTLGIGAF